MRVLGRVIIGLAVVVVGYMCVDIFLLAKPTKKAPAHRVPDRVGAENDKLAELRSPVRVEVEVAHAARPMASAPLERSPAQHPPPDRSAELHATLEAEYSQDPLPTRASVERERLLGQIFAKPELQGKGQLQELSCRESICRGVVKIANESVDNEVFGRTLLSNEFDRAVPDAFSVSAREKMADGSIRATFFIHPPGVFDLLPSLPD